MKKIILVMVLCLFVIGCIKKPTVIDTSEGCDYEIIVNSSRGTTIAAHRFVYLTGYSGGIPTVDLAKANSLATMPAICVTIESIAPDALGRCMRAGLIQDVNTNSYDVGTIYVSATTAGVPTNTAPINPYLTQEMGSILVKSATVGEIQIISRALTGDVLVNGQKKFTKRKNEMKVDEVLTIEDKQFKRIK